MGNTITQADVSAANWANETAAAAEAYAENQADEAARQRDAQRAREEQGDGSIRRPVAVRGQIQCLTEFRAHPGRGSRLRPRRSS